MYFFTLLARKERTKEGPPDILYFHGYIYHATLGIRNH